MQVRARVWTWVALWLTMSASGKAQIAPPADDPAVTLFPDSQGSRYWISGQDNMIIRPSRSAPTWQEIRGIAGRTSWAAYSCQTAFPPIIRNIWLWEAWAFCSATAG